MPRKLVIRNAPLYAAAFFAVIMIVLWYRGTPDLFTWPFLLLTLCNLAITCGGLSKIARFINDTPDSPEKRVQVRSRLEGMAISAVLSIFMAFYLGTLVAGGLHLKGQHNHIAGWWH